MLSLTVRAGDYITIGDDIVVQVLKTGDVFRLAVDAPRSMQIERAKIREQSGAAPECIQRVQKLPATGKYPKRAQSSNAMTR